MFANGDSCGACSFSRVQKWLCMSSKCSTLGSKSRSLVIGFRRVQSRNSPLDDRYPSYFRNFYKQRMFESMLEINAEERCCVYNRNVVAKHQVLVYLILIHKLNLMTREYRDRIHPATQENAQYAKVNQVRKVHGSLATVSGPTRPDVLNREVVQRLFNARPPDHLETPSLCMASR